MIVNKNSLNYRLVKFINAGNVLPSNYINDLIVSYFLVFLYVLSLSILPLHFALDFSNTVGEAFVVVSSFVWLVSIIFLTKTLLKYLYRKISSIKVTFED